MRHLLDKHIPTVNTVDTNTNFGGHWGYAIFSKAFPSSRRGASCEILIITINQRASMLQWLHRSI